MTKEEIEICEQLRMTNFPNYQVFAAPKAATLIEQQAEIIRLNAMDWADDDTRVKELAKPFFTEKEINGDKFGVPGVIDIAELMVRRIEQQAKRIEDLEYSVRNGDAFIKKATEENEQQAREIERLQSVIQTHITYPTLKEQNEKLVRALEQIAGPSEFADPHQSMDEKSTIAEKALTSIQKGKVGP